MTDKTLHHEPNEEQSTCRTINRIAKVFKKFNAYDRGKERKNKQLYDYE